MESEITGRNVKVTRELRKTAEEGLERIEPFTGRGASAHVILSTRRNVHIVEVTVTARRHKVVGVAEAPGTIAALRAAMEKAEKQAVRWKKTKIERKRQGKPARTALALEMADGTAETGLEPDRKPVAVNGRASELHIIPAQESMASRRMTVEEAVKEAESGAHPIFVFRDPVGDLKVLHCAGDGLVRLIEVSGD